MMYLDSSHGGWLGWEHSLMDYLAILEKINVVRPSLPPSSPA